MTIRTAWIAVALLALPAVARAEEVSVQAGLDRNVAAVGEQVTLTVVVRGARSAGGPKLPPMPAFTVYSAGSSRNFSLVNGQFSASAQFSFVVVPRSPGHFRIDPVEVEADGKTYRSASLELDVNASAPARPMPSVPGGGAPAPAPGNQGSARARGFFVRASVDRLQCYVGQQVTWTFKFYQSNARLVRTPEYSAPALTGFWSEDLPPQRNYYEVVDGRQYYVTELRMALFPTSPGKHGIGSASLRLEVEEPIQVDVDDPFSIFDQMRGRIQGATLKTPPFSVEARTPPDPPAGFKGAVGSYTMEASVDRSELPQGEPVTLTLRIRGRGNVKTVPDPELPAMNNFKMYPGNTTLNLQKSDGTVSGEKLVQTMLVPGVVGEYTIPPLSLVYFDPELRGYRSLQTRPIPIRVRPGEVVVPGNVAQVAPRPSVRDVRFIKTGPARWRLPEKSLLGDVGLWAWEASPLAVLLLGGLWFGALRHRFPGRASNHGSRAESAARAMGHAASGAVEEAAALAERAYRDLLCESLALPAGSSSGQIRSIAEARADGNTAELLIGPLERLEQLRYAPGSLAPSEVQKLAQAIVRGVRSSRKVRARRSGK